MNKQKRILFVISSLGSGGAERVITTLSNEMAKRGYSVQILLTYCNQVSYQISDTVKLVELDNIYKNEYVAIKRVIARIKAIRNVIKTCDPEIVVSFIAATNIDVCFAAQGIDVPLVISERNDPLIEPASKVKQFLRRIAYQRADGYVFQTPDAQSFFSKHIQRKSVIIPNPLTTRIPEPYCGPRKKRVVAVGRLNQQKNYSLLLGAFERFSSIYPDYRLDIYGEGPQENEIRAMLENKKITNVVNLKGFCSDVHNQIKDASFFVMTSDFEGMPNALIEAMALGLPCISTDCRCGGPRMLISNGKNGLLVPTRDEDALLKAMLQLAENPEYAKEIGQNAIQIREQVNTEKIVNQWLEYIGLVHNQRIKK